MPNENIDISMPWYTAIFLGLVQGLAEFLPVSSSGHLLLFEHLFGITDGGLLLTLILHLATLLAVVVVYWRQLWQMIRHPFSRATVQLVVATVITCGMVLVFNDVIDRLFNIQALPFLFIVCGVYLLLPNICQPRTNQKTWRQTIAMGIAQGVAVVPGLSRSGLTITTGRLSGMAATDATDFSFVMSLPIILASLLYELMRGGSLQTLGVGSVALAFATAFLSGIVAIKFMLNITRKIDLRWFAIYLLLLGSCLLCGQVLV